MQNDSNSFKDPFVPILQLKPAANYTTLIQNQQLLEIIDVKNFPKINKNVEKAKKQYSKNVSRTKILNDLKFQFVFQPDSIIQILKLQNIKPCERDFVSIYIFYAYIAWSESVEKYNSLENIDLILDSLIFAQNSSNTDLAITTFLYVIDTFLRKAEVSRIPAIMICLRSFFLIPNQIPNIAYSLFRRFVNEVFLKIDCDYTSFFQTISQIIDHYSIRFPAEELVLLVQSLMPFADRLDMNTLLFLKQVIDSIPDNIQMSYVNLLSQKLIFVIMSQNFEFDIVLPTSKTFCFDEDVKFLINYVFPDNRTFPDGLEMIKFEKIRVVEREDIFSTDFLKIVKIVSDMFRKEKQQEFLQSFISCLKGYVYHKNYFYLAALLLYFLKDYQNTNVFVPAEILFTPMIFNPDISIKDDTMANRIIDYIRDMAFEKLLKDGIETALHAFSIGFRYQTLFFDMIRRAYHHSDFLTVIIEDEGFIEFLSNTLVYYQDLEFKGEDVEYIRAAQFTMINYLFQNPELTNTFFTNPRFCRVFISFLLEEGLDDFILKNILTYLLATDNLLIPTIFGEIISTLAFEDTRAIVLLTKILEMLCRLLQERRQYSTSCVCVIDLIFEKIGQISPSKLSENCLIEIFHFFYMMTNDIHFDRTRGLLLTTIVQRFTEQAVYYDPIFALMHGNDSSIINHPTILTMFFKLFYKVSQKCRDTLYELCLRSDINIAACHKAEIDIELIEIMYSSKTTDQTMYNSAKDLFRQIAFYSSNSVIEKFFSMINKSQSVDCLDCFYLVLKQEIEEPKTISPLKHNVTTALPSLTELNSGLSFVSWIRLDYSNPNSMPMLFTLHDEDEKQSIHFYFKDKCLVKQFNDESVILVDDIQPHQWHFVAITYSNDCKNKDNMIFFNDTKKQIKQFDNEFDHVQMKVGGSFTENDISTSYLGPFIVSDQLTEQDIDFIRTNGIEKYTKETFFTYSPPSRRLFRANSFCILLTTNFEPFLLFPIMKILKSNEEQSKFLRNLKALMFLDQNVEYELAKNEVFSHFKVYFPQTCKHLLNYEFYNKLTELFECVKTQELRNHMFDSILTDLSVWSTIDHNDLLKIINHWKSFDPKLFTFSNLLSQSLTYLQGDCLKASFEILQSLEYTVEDFSLLLSFVRQPKDETYIPYILGLIRTCIDTKVFKADLFPLLHSLLSSSSQDIVLLVLKILNQTEVDINLIMRHISNEVMSFEFLQGVMEIMNDDFPELYPLCCWIAFAIGGESSLQYLNQNVCLSRSYFSRKDSALWPIIVSFTQSSEVIRENMMFLAKNCINDWTTIYDTIELVSSLINMSSRPLKQEFIKAISLIIQSDKQEIKDEQINTYITLTRHFIFYDNKNKNMIVDAISFSPFAEKTKKKKGKGDKEQKEGNGIQIWLPSVIMKAFEINDLKKLELKFGLDIDINGNWKDKYLVKDAIEVIIDKDLPFTSVLLYFYLKYDIPYCMEKINKLQFDEENKMYQELLFYKIKQLGIETDLIKPESLFNNDAIEHFDLLFRASRLKPLIILNKEIIHLLNQSSVKYNKSLQELATFQNDLQIEFDEKVEKQIGLRKHWGQIYEAMTIKGAPWEMHEDLHFKRDPTVCRNGVPVKLKRNNHFDQHLDAQYKPKPIKKRKVYKNIDHFIPKQVEIPKWVVLDSENPVLITPNGGNTVEFEIGSDYFILEHRKYLLIHIRFVVPKLYLNQPTAVEIYLTSGRSFFLNFPNISMRSQVLDKLNYPFGELATYTDKWVNNLMSNFDYIMVLNILSGRSYNSSLQYPIFPWVLMDFESEKLDVKKNNTFRDFMKPVAAFDNNRLQFLKRFMSNLEEIDPPGYLASNSMLPISSVFNYLQRIEPYATYLVKYNNGSFLAPELEFNSMKKILERVSTEFDLFSELTPEFFSSPEFLMNINNFSNGEVEMPPWAKSPIDFVYKMRKALESDQATKKIHHWFDLIWGMKQHDKKANNVYMNPLYPDSNIEDINALATNGQVPKQLFTSPHPRHSRYLAKEKISFNSQLSNCLLFATIKKKGNSITIHGIETEGTLATLVVANGIVTTDQKRYIPQFVSDWSSLPIVRISNSYVYFKATRQILNLDDLKWTSFNQELFAARRNWIMSSNLSRIDLYSMNNVLSPYRSFPIYSNPLKCGAVSVNYHIAVVGIEAGSLIIYPLEQGSSISLIDLQGYCPEKVFVTKSWGFIVTYAFKFVNGIKTNYLFVHNVNGLFVLSQEIEPVIDQITTWCSTGGFDYFAFSDPDGYIYYAEVFKMNIKRADLWYQGKIVSMEYFQSMQVLAVVTAAGKVHIESFLPLAH